MKDPAFLFYPGDWLGGTMSMTRAQKGAYMDLLICQFNESHMSLETVKQVLGESDFQTMWESKLKAKFIQDSSGLFYNEKLEVEILRRKKYTESRKNNRSKPNRKDDISETHESHMSGHMSPHMETINEDLNNTGISKNRALEKVTKTAKVLINPNGYELIKAALERQFTNESQIELIRGECKFKGDVRAEIVHFASHYADNGLSKKEDHAILNRFRGWLIKSKQFNKQEDDPKKPTSGYKIGEKPTQKA